MTKFQSKKVFVNASCEEVYEFMADFNNFEKLMPSKVSGWEATNDTCSFKIDGIGTLSMRIVSKQPGKSINIISDGDNPVEYKLDCYFFKYGKNQCEIAIDFDAELNSFMKMVASNPLQNFVNMLAEKVKEVYEK